MPAVRVVVFLALVALGCQTELGTRTGLVALEVALEGSSAMVLSRTVTTQPNPPVLGRVALTWHARDASGRLVASGDIEDGRAVTFEDPVGHREAGANLLGTVAHFRVVVPRIEGTVDIEDASGVVASFPISRRAGVRSESLLDADADILGPATVAPGSATGPNRVLIVPEGFTEAEQATFHELVRRMLVTLRALPDYGRTWERFTFLEQEVRSAQSGIDRPATTDSAASEVDTAFDVSMGIGGVYRCAFFESRAARVAVERLRDAAGAAVVIVLPNTNEWCGCAQAGLTVNAAEDPARVAEVVAHELGHALFGLGDEYDSDGSTHGAGCGAVAEPNVASDLRRLPWADLLTTTELPTTSTTAAGVVGAFEGAGYCTTGRYRPSHNCLMRNAYTPFCPVCRREMERRLGYAMPVATGGEPADGIHRRITVSNRTGAGLWAACASAAGPGCSAWVWIEDGGEGEVESFDGRYVLDNQDHLPSSPIRRTFTADRDVVEVVASSAAPIVETASPGCSDTCRFARDGVCDDGAEGSLYAVCERGTDCADCGPRAEAATPRPDRERCDDSCTFAGDGVCDDGSDGRTAFCDRGTDCADCAAPTSMCTDTCTWPNDGECDDGGPGSLHAVCPLGSDCGDCGPR